MSKQEVVAKAQFAVLLGGHVEITGMWVWVRFDEKPSEDIREQLKAEGFKWSKHKEKWYFAGKPACSKRSSSWLYIVGKYGLETLDEATV